MQVNTGKGSISAMVVVAIWSLSLAVDLPGLAVTPIEGQLRSIFHDATDFKIQLLTVLPNLVIIPFVLLSGRLSESRHKISVIVAGTALYVVAGALSIFSGSLNMLIFLSCLLGAGCGLILPFSTGLVADVFVGKYRMKQMGIVSAIGNVALVLATFVVGFLAAVSWHLPFLVYLLPLVSLFLLPFLRRIPQGGVGQSLEDIKVKQQDVPVAGIHPGHGPAVKGGFYIGRMIWLLLAYFFFVFATTIPSYYLPDISWIDAESASTMTSVIYFAMFAMGMALTPFMRCFRKMTFVAAAAFLVIGFGIYIFTHSFVPYVIASAITGLGNGIAQPIFYTKATEVVVSESKATLSLAYIQVANYVAISLVPVVIDSVGSVFNRHGSSLFPFIFAGIAAVAVLAVVIVRSRPFVFGMSEKYY